MPKQGRPSGSSDGLLQLRRRSRIATRRLIAPPAALVALTTVIAALPTDASADVGSDQQQISQLEQEIGQQGAQVANLVAAYDQALTAEQLATNRVVAAQARLASDQQTENQAMTVLRQIALSTYMSNTQNNSALAIFSSASPESVVAQQEYSQIANETLRDTVDAVTIDVRQTEATAAQLRAAQAQAQANLAAAASAKNSAQAALAQDDALLAQVKGNLAQLMEQEQQREEQEEQQLAAAQAAANPVNVTFSPSTGTYTDPLANIRDLTPERVDQGVDYSGYGPITAVGDAEVMSTSNSGWPGGTFICYKLLDGPAAGLVMYAAEDIEPLVSVGQQISAGQTIGNMYEGPDGIETGWADPSCDSVTMARDYGQFSGANSTAFGANYSQLLQYVGAPPGVMQNEPATGSLPSNWPQW